MIVVLTFKLFETAVSRATNSWTVYLNYPLVISHYNILNTNRVTHVNETLLAIIRQIVNREIGVTFMFGLGMQQKIK